MKAVLSDIHGNLEALIAVLADIESKNIREIVCLGDIVGYGPNPRECLELTRRSDTLIMGNHEEAVLKASAGHFNLRARRAIEWTRRQLFEDPNETERARQERRALVEHFQLQANILGIQYVHGSPRNPVKEYITPQDARNKRKMASIFEHTESVCFIGHSHIPGVFIPEDFSSPEELMGLYMLGDERALVNVGSVGQPRDGDPSACYVTFDEETVVFRRVEYDVEKTVKKIRAISELDNFLADRLRRGR
jgi:predicted phosphodiesterase